MAHSNNSALKGLRKKNYKFEAILCYTLVQCQFELYRKALTQKMNIQTSNYDIKGPHLPLFSMTEDQKPFP